MSFSKSVKKYSMHSFSHISYRHAFFSFILPFYDLVLPFLRKITPIPSGSDLVLITTTIRFIFCFLSKASFSPQYYITILLKMVTDFFDSGVKFHLKSMNQKGLFWLGRNEGHISSFGASSEHLDVQRKCEKHIFDFNLFDKFQPFNLCLWLITSGIRARPL